MRASGERALLHSALRPISVSPTLKERHFQFIHFVLQLVSKRVYTQRPHSQSTTPRTLALKCVFVNVRACVCVLHTGLPGVAFAGAFC